MIFPSLSLSPVFKVTLLSPSFSLSHSKSRLISSCPSLQLLLITPLKLSANEFPPTSSALPLSLSLSPLSPKAHTSFVLVHGLLMWRRRRPHGGRRGKRPFDSVFGRAWMTGVGQKSNGGKNLKISLKKKRLNSICLTTKSRVHMNTGWQLHWVWVLSHFESLHQSPSVFTSMKFRPLPVTTGLRKFNCGMTSTSCFVIGGGATENCWMICPLTAQYT